MNVLYIRYNLDAFMADTHTLTGVGNFKPGSGCQDALPGVCAGVVTVLIPLWRKHVRHSEDETQKPGDQDRHDDLEREREKWSLILVAQNTHIKRQTVRRYDITLPIAQNVRPTLTRQNN